MSRRTHRRRLIHEEVIPKVSAMLEAATRGLPSETEIRIHDADSMWILRMELIREV